MRKSLNNHNCLKPIQTLKKKKKATQEKLEKLVAKPEEESTYLPVEEKEDYRTEAEKQFDERLKQQVCL